MGLKRIALRDFVIVRELELDLSGGFSVLTGETGAGKSILIDALQLALGARAEAAVVREGAARADITAEFDDLCHAFSMPLAGRCHGLAGGARLLQARLHERQVPPGRRPAPRPTRRHPALPILRRRHPALPILRRRTLP